MLKEVFRLSVTALIVFLLYKVLFTNTEYFVCSGCKKVFSKKDMIGDMCTECSSVLLNGVPLKKLGFDELECSVSPFLYLVAESGYNEYETIEKLRHRKRPRRHKKNEVPPWKKRNLSNFTLLGGE
jgi:hypothetical protein